jgi:Protein of unknown function (DUF1203)
MQYRISGLDPTPFQHLFGLHDDALKALGAQRYPVDQCPGFPDRIQLRDLAIGETALLLNFEHQSAPTPYRASHAIFIAEGAKNAAHFVNETPQVMQRRMLSVRAFDVDHCMIDADLVDGLQLEAQIQKFFDQQNIAYLHVHYAKRGCFAGLVRRA